MATGDPWGRAPYVSQPRECSRTCALDGLGGLQRNPQLTRQMGKEENHHGPWLFHVAPPASAMAFSLKHPSPPPDVSQINLWPPESGV